MGSGKSFGFRGSRQLPIVGLILPCVIAVSVGGLAAQRSAEMLFDKVELRTTFGAGEEGRGGRLAVSGETIRFVDKSGGAYFSIPASAVTDLYYSRVSGRRIKTAVFVSPLILFSKGKKHYLTISFNDGEGLVGAVEFRLDKKNYRGVLRAVESVANVTLEFDQEGIKDEKETVAVRSDAGLMREIKKGLRALKAKKAKMYTIEELFE